MLAMGVGWETSGGGGGQGEGASGEGGKWGGGEGGGPGVHLDFVRQPTGLRERSGMLTNSFHGAFSTTLPVFDYSSGITGRVVENAP